MLSRLASLALVCLLAGPALAAQPEDTIRSKLAAAIPGVQVTSVRATPLTGIYEVVLDGSETVHVSADGNWIINGDLLQASDRGLVNVTDRNKSGQRKDTLAKLDRSDLIAFRAQGKERGLVYVFTDVDCGYCRKFHQEVPKLNAAGITVYYLAFPRGGLAGDTFRKMQGVWCAADRNRTMTDAKRGVVPPVAPVACKSPVAGEYQLGVNLGVRGTPAVFLADGRQVGGYLPARQLLDEMGLK